MMLSFFVNEQTSVMVVWMVGWGGWKLNPLDM